MAVVHGAEPGVSALPGGPRWASDRGTATGRGRTGPFADATGDRRWIHVDRERAASGPFGTTVAHGCPALSPLPVPVPRAMRAERGTDRVRLPAPVPAGSRVRATAVVRAVEETAGGRGRLPWRRWSAGAATGRCAPPGRCPASSPEPRPGRAPSP